MKLTIEHTDAVVKLPGGVLARAWEGRTEKGSPVLVFIPYLSIPSHSDSSELDELVRQGSVVQWASGPTPPPQTAALQSNENVLTVCKAFWHKTAQVGREEG